MPKPEGESPCVDHFALDAQDMPAFEARLAAAGQPFKRVQLADTHVWQLFLTDPDGAKVELSSVCERGLHLCAVKL